MNKYIVIERADHPGSYWADAYGEFKGWLFRTKFSSDPNNSYVMSVLNEATKLYPCQLVTIYENE